MTHRKEKNMIQVISLIQYETGPEIFVKAHTGTRHYCHPTSTSMARLSIAIALDDPENWHVMPSVIGLVGWIALRKEEKNV